MNKAEITILKPPNCKGVSPTKPFLMRMKELPQISDKTIRRLHFLDFDWALIFFKAAN